MGRAGERAAVIPAAGGISPPPPTGGGAAPKGRGVWRPKRPIRPPPSQEGEGWGERPRPSREGGNPAPFRRPRPRRTLAALHHPLGATADSTATSNRFDRTAARARSARRRRHQVAPLALVAWRLPRRAGAVGRLRRSGRRRRGDPDARSADRRLRREGQARRTEAPARGRGVRHAHLRRRTHSHAAAQPRTRVRREGQGDRPHRAHPRRIRPPRPHPRGPVAGGTGAGRVPAAQARRPVEPPRTPGRRHRHARPRRDADRDRPPPHRRPHRAHEGRTREGAPPSRPPPRTAPQERRPRRRPRRLHERGKEQPDERRLLRRSGRPRPALLDPRPGYPPGAPAGRTHGAVHRHGRLHPETADHAGGGLPRDAGRGRRGRRARARG